MLKIILNRSQKIIFFMAFMVITGFFVVWFIIYSPAKGRMKMLKEELTAVESEVNRIQRVSGGENLDIAYKRLYKTFTELTKMIPKEERTTLSVLSSEANRVNIEVLAIKLIRAKISDLPVSVKSGTVLEMPISMNIRCDYITLGEYLDAIRNKMPTLISIDSVSMKKARGKKEAVLDVSIEMTLFMLTG